MRAATMDGYYWNLKVHAGRKYDPSQPRVPAGDSRGGQWTSGGHPWVEAAVQKYGTTEDLKEAGFILPDGSMLNIRDKDDPYLALPGVSRLQHYAVAAEAMGGDEEARRGAGHLEPLWKFMQGTGVVRLYVSSFRPEAAVSVVGGSTLTSRQRQRVLELAQDPEMELTYDILDLRGSTLAHGQIRNRLDAAAWFRRVAEMAGAKEWL